MIFPQVGFGAEEAAKSPLIAQERIDLEALLGGQWLEADEVVVLERGELLAALAGDELRFGVEAGFESVEARDGLAFGSARTRGLLRVELVGCDLTWGSHEIPRRLR